MRSRVFVFLFTAVALMACVSPAQAARPQTNVILILADDLGYGDVGYHGCRDVPTPHIDSLARDGVRFTSGYAPHPFCSPTRAALLTGRYQHRFGHENNPPWAPDNDEIGLPVDQVTLPELLRKAGYATGIIGKWHLGGAPCFHPRKRGFTDFYGFLGGGHMYLPGRKGAAEYNAPLQHNGRTFEESGYLTDVFSREAVRFVEAHEDQPFFLYLSYNAVHGPLQATARYLERFQSIPDERRRTYAAMLSAMDDGIGLLLERLRDLKLEESTLIFFMSDNGGPPAANASSNEPLRGTKGQVFEGGIRVPFLARWKGHLSPGRKFQAPVSGMDLFPTMLAACGVEIPKTLPLDGVNLLPHLRGDQSGTPHERLFWRVGGGSGWAVREGKWKCVRPPDGARLLFDVENDLSEQTDLADARPEVVERLTKAYEDWNTANVAPRWEGIRTGRNRSR